VFQQLI